MEMTLLFGEGWGEPSSTLFFRYEFQSAELGMADPTIMHRLTEVEYGAVDEIGRLEISRRKSFITMQGQNRA
jgi:hypothetical protein